MESKIIFADWTWFGERWWDDALRAARQATFESSRRHRVYSPNKGKTWIAEEINAPR